MKNVCFVREKKLNVLVLRFCLSQKIVQSNIDEVGKIVRWASRNTFRIYITYNVASQSNKSFSFKWKWPILHPSSLYCTSFFGGRKEASKKLSFKWKIPTWIGHYSIWIWVKLSCIVDWESVGQNTLVINVQKVFETNKYIVPRRRKRITPWPSLRKAKTP